MGKNYLFCLNRNKFKFAATYNYSNLCKTPKMTQHFQHAYKKQPMEEIQIIKANKVINALTQTYLLATLKLRSHLRATKQAIINFLCRVCTWHRILISEIAANGDFVNSVQILYNTVEKSTNDWLKRYLGPNCYVWADVSLLPLQFLLAFSSNLLFGSQKWKKNLEQWFQSTSQRKIMLGGKLKK